VPAASTSSKPAITTESSSSGPDRALKLTRLPACLRGGPGFGEAHGVWRRCPLTRRTAGRRLQARELRAFGNERMPPGAASHFRGLRRLRSGRRSHGLRRGLAMSTHTRPAC
jgi:hypothetical protein